MTQPEEKTDNGKTGDYASPSSPAVPPSLGTILRVWLTLGVQSFGGGAATLTLTKRAVVEQHKWLTEEDFTQIWSLCQVVPGINQIALSLLLGRRIAGYGGMALAAVGLLLPSVTLTILMTAGYRHVQHLKAIRDALHGVIPATVGLGLVTAMQMACPPLKDSRSEGYGSLCIGLTLLAASGMALFLWHAPVIVILVIAGLVGALLHWWRGARVAKGQAPP